MLSQYLDIEKNTRNMILSEAMIQLVNGSLMLILFLFMEEKGYSDADKAFYFVFRFIGVLFLSFPFGLYIKGRRLLPFFKIAALLVPIMTFFAIYAISNHNNVLLCVSFLLWGIAFSFSQICKLPFVFRHCQPSHVTQSITLTYATWSFGNVLGGIIIYSLSKIFPSTFDAQNCLIFTTLISLFSFYFLTKINEKEPIETKSSRRKNNLNQYDWNLIWLGMFPTLLIAIGAGMSIPFMNLFFEKAFNTSYSDFALLGFVTHVIVFLLTVSTPYFKRKLGYHLAIPITQFLSVGSLVLLAYCEKLNHISGIYAFAIFLFIIRQPLMNIAQPMTTEVIMKYVGKKNHEIVSALFALIWNGSFVFSGFMFGWMRSLKLPYFDIFMITAVFYIIAIFGYMWLLKQPQSEEEEAF